MLPSPPENAENGVLSNASFTNPLIAAVPAFSALLRESSYKLLDSFAGTRTAAGR
jgi:hypothetical protein